MNDNIYIARDKDGFLGIYVGEPTYNEEFDTFDDNGNGNFIGCIDSDLCPEVTFENSPVELKPVINNG